MKIAAAVIPILSLSLLTVFSVQSGDYTYAGDKDVAKNVIAEPSELDVSFIMPGWLAGIEGRIGFNPDVITGIDAGIDDILPTIDMIFASTVEIRKDKLGFILDGMYMKIGINGETPGPILDDISMTAKQALVEGVMTYRFFESDKAWVEVLAGGRYQYLGTEVSFTANGPGIIVPAGPGTLSAVNSWVDPFIGVQARYQFNDKWYASARGDYGGLGVSSESTYNLFGVVGYQIKPRASMELGYRYLYTDYTNGGFLYDMPMKGAFLGFRIDL